MIRLLLALLVNQFTIALRRRTDGARFRGKGPVNAGGAMVEIPADLPADPLKKKVNLIEERSAREAFRVLGPRCDRTDRHLRKLPPAAFCEVINGVHHHVCGSHKVNQFRGVLRHIDKCPAAIAKQQSTPAFGNLVAVPRIAPLPEEIICEGTSHSPRTTPSAKYCSVSTTRSGDHEHLCGSCARWRRYPGLFTVTDISECQIAASRRQA